jgi:uncharacterized protein YndB with AHSA1/START domain
MARPTKETTINAPADKVFAYVADFTKHPEWALHPLQITPESNEPTHLGTKFRSVGHQFGRDNTNEVTVTEFEPDRRLVYESTSKDGHFRHSFELQASGETTRLSKSFEPISAPLVGKLMMPLVTGILVPKALVSDLARIKAKLE